MTALAINNNPMLAWAQAFYETHKKTILLALALIALMAVSSGVFAAATTDTWANTAYDFVYGMATGKFTRAICIVGGIVATMLAAGSGKPIIAMTGVVLAAFGFLSPTLINAIFGTALI